MQGVVESGHSAGQSVMSYLLSWYNLVFFIPLVVGLLLVVGMAFGSTHEAGDADADAPGHIAEGAEIGHMEPATAWWLGVASVLGVGRVPVTLVAMTFLLTFAGFGIALNTLLASLIRETSVFALASVILATLGAYFSTGSLARLFARFLPTTESYNIRAADLTGCLGTLVVASDERSGLCDVKDREGNLHRVSCRTNGGKLRKNLEVVVTDYDERLSVYFIESMPELAASSEKGNAQ